METPSWTLYIDGSSTTMASSAGIVFVSPEDASLEYALQFSFLVTNNEVEYEALITGLKLAKELEISVLQVFSDSRLMVGQVNGQCEARDPSMIKYLTKVHELLM